MDKFFQKIKIKFSKNIYFMNLLKGSSIGFVFKVFGMLLGYIYTFIIAQYYGADTLGLFVLSITLLNIFATIGILGLDTALVKFVAEYYGNGKNYLIKEIYKKSFIITAPLSILLAFSLFFGASFFSIHIFKNFNLIFFFQIISLAIIPLVFLRINIAFFKALRKIVKVSFFESISVFLIAIVLLFSLSILLFKEEIVIISHTLSIFLTMIISFLFLKNSPFILEKAKQNFLIYKDILKVSFPMLLTSSMFLVMGWVDVIILGIFRTEEEVGIYSVVMKLASTTSIILMAVNTVVAPKFSEYYSKDDMKAFKNLAKIAVKIVFYFSTPIIIILSIFSHKILGFFGSEFVLGIYALWILMAGQLVNAMNGSVKIMLDMTKYFYIVRNISLTILTLNIILNYFLIQKWGLEGAAVSTAFCVIMWNVLMSFFVYKFFNFLPILGILPWKK